jgi:hypothetical protein
VSLASKLNTNGTNRAKAPQTPIVRVVPTKPSCATALPSFALLLCTSRCYYCALYAVPVGLRNVGAFVYLLVEQVEQALSMRFVAPTHALYRPGNSPVGLPPGSSPVGGPRSQATHAAARWSLCEGRGLAQLAEHAPEHAKHVPVDDLNAAC